MLKWSIQRRQVFGALAGVAAMLSSTAVLGQDNEPLNVAEWQSAIEILSAARASVVAIGWQQGARSEVPENCVATALERSWRKLGKGIVEFDYARAALNDAINVSGFSTRMASISNAPEDPLSVPYWGRYYMYWNDAQGRTVEEVVAVFDRAVEHARAQKDAAYKAQRTEKDLYGYDQSIMRALGLTK